jgi:hypothetical protein
VSARLAHADDSKPGGIHLLGREPAGSDACRVPARYHQSRIECCRRKIRKGACNRIHPRHGIWL